MAANAKEQKIVCNFDREQLHSGEQRIDQKVGDVGMTALQTAESAELYRQL